MSLGELDFSLTRRLLVVVIVLSIILFIKQLLSPEGSFG